MKRTCVTYDFQVWLCRQRRIAKFHSFVIFNLGSLGYIVSIKLCTRALVIYNREQFFFIKARRCRRPIVIGFITTYAISAYHH